jgi:RNA polymerase sigma-70 factor (ECF subfamily)
MSDGAGQQTRQSLLERLRLTPNDQSAWDEFVARYGPKIHGWCRGWNLQEADAQDVTQTVLVRLAAKLRTFVYDPSGSFRAWLKTLTRHAWSDFVADRQRAGAGTGDSRVVQVLQTVAARDDLEARLEEVFDLELLEHASTRVRARVEPHTWEAFRLTALDGLSGADAAGRLGMPVASVFKAKSNVQKMLQDEIARLERVAES